VRHVVAQRRIILAIVTFRKVTSLGLREGKTFCECAGSNPDPMLTEVAAALARRDVDCIAATLREHYTFGEREPAARFAIALVESFG